MPSNAAYFREYRKTPQFKSWSEKHEATPERKAARKVYQKTWKANHPEKVAAHRAKGRDIARAAKSVPCVDCGGTFPPECMDFDHREGETKHPRLTYKLNGYRKVPISMTALACSSPIVFQEELAKCDVVCANCHRIRTTKRRKARGK
jgi:hypothetical protein